MFVSFFIRASAAQLCILMVLPYGIFKLTDFGGSPIERGLLLAYFMVVFFGWLYSVGTCANRRLEPHLQISPLYLRVAVIVPFVYLPVFVFMFLLPLYQGNLQHPPQMMILLHFISIFAAAYCIWYCAKQLTTLRLNSDTGFIDYYTAFMGFWFCFIGVWFLQPRVIELLGTDSVDQSSD